MGDIIGGFIGCLMMGIPLLAIWTAHQRKMFRMRNEAGAGHNAQLSRDAAEKIAALENRVRVLERIVTDANGHLGSGNLAAEIEALRAPARLPEKAL